MVRVPSPRPEGRQELALVLPALVGAGTVLACSVLLPAIAGPDILPQAKVVRFVGGIWASHALLFVLMGYAGGLLGKKQSWVTAPLLGALTGLGAALFYTRLGLLAPGAAALVGLPICGAVAGTVGAGLGLALPTLGLWPLLAGLGVGCFALAATFLHTGVVSGKVMRTINQSTQGMLTSQQDVPVPGVAVVLCTPDGKTRLYEDTTDQGGHFAINGPGQGEYMLYVHDTEPNRGSGQWVSDRIKVASHFTGEGLGHELIMLPTYREETGSPFVDDLSE